MAAEVAEAVVALGEGHWALGCMDINSALGIGLVDAEVGKGVGSAEAVEHDVS